MSDRWQRTAPTPSEYQRRKKQTNRDREGCAAMPWFYEASSISSVPTSARPLLGVRADIAQTRGQGLSHPTRGRTRIEVLNRLRHFTAQCSRADQHFQESAKL